MCGGWQYTEAEGSALPSVKGTLRVINCFGFIICVLYSIVLLQLCSPVRRAISLHGRSTLWIHKAASFSQLVYPEFNRKRTGCEQREVSRMRAQQGVFTSDKCKYILWKAQSLERSMQKVSLDVLKGEHRKRWIPSGLGFGGSGKQVQDD